MMTEKDAVANGYQLGSSTATEGEVEHDTVEQQDQKQREEAKQKREKHNQGFMMTEKGAVANGNQLGSSAATGDKPDPEIKKLFKERKEKEDPKWKKMQQDTASKTMKCTWDPNQLFKDLFQKDMIPDNAIAQWYILGIHLGITTARLDIIKSNVTPGDVVVNCRAMLKAWKDSQRSGKTDVLIQALKACEFIAYVENVVKKDLSGKDEVDDNYLLNIVAPNIAPKWQEVAIQLGFSNTGNFAEYVDLCGERFRQMLKQWLDSNKADSLDEVLDEFHQALNGIQLNAAAEVFLNKSKKYREISGKLPANSTGKS